MGLRGIRRCRDGDGRAGKRRLDELSRQRHARGADAPDALLIDMGSTTTDIVPIVGGGPMPRGLTDGERLATGELVYTGLTRTDVSVVAQRAQFKGASNGSPPAASPTWPTCAASSASCPTASISTPRRRARQVGRGKHRALRPLLRPRCRRRNARGLAQRRTRYRRPADGRSARRHRRCLGRGSTLPAGAPIVAAGIGASLIEALAQALGRVDAALRPLCRLPHPIARVGDPLRARRRRRAAGVAAANALGAEGGDLFHQPAPGFFLARPRGLGDGDLKILQLGVDLFRRQHLKAGDQHGAFQHRRLRAIEALPRPVARLVHETARIARPLSDLR